MDELDLISSLRPAEPLADARDLAAARHTLTATLTATLAADHHDPYRHGSLAGGSRGGRAGQPGIRRFWRLATAITATASAGIAIALTVTGAPRPATTARSHLRVAAHSVPATLTAAQFLTAAAAATRYGHAVAPRPDQYVYTENISHGSGWTKEWLSADGSRAGLSLASASGLATVEPACTPAQAQATGCFVAAGYLPGLPANSHEVLPYLAKLDLAAAGPPAGQDTPHWLDNDTGKAAAQLMSTTYLMPGQASALFQLLAHTPGFKLIPHAVDALGRRGVGIYWSYQGGGAMIVFDPATYRYLGFGTWPTGKQPLSSSGGVAAPYGSALKAMAVVNTEPAVTRWGATSALLRQAKLWATKQHPHHPWTTAEALAAYLRQVRHLSPAQIKSVLLKTLGHAR
jgi:hypothetical protein